MVVRSFRRLRAVRVIALVALIFGRESAPAQGQGVFAHFTTSMGNFTARLEHEKTPMTVANFVGLIEGSQAYVDLETGLIERGHFYDGIIFHRVIEGFMNQSGSPAGTGRDGPGYQFEDEFDDSLGHESHVLSMANSGPGTNGSQFFVTVEPQPHLDGRHTVFGRVVGGMDVVEAINRVPTTADRPDEDVVIETLRIERVGEEAMAFRVEEQGLPAVAPLSLGIVPDRTLRFESQPGQFVRLSASVDLRDWIDAAGSVSGLGYQDASGAVILAPAVPEGASAQYYAASAVIYPEPYLTSAHVRERVLTFTTSAQPPQTVIYRFDGEDGGTAQLDASAELPITGYVYAAATNRRASLTISSGGIAGTLRFSMEHETAAAGRFSADILSGGGVVGRLSGAFELASGS